MRQAVVVVAVAALAGCGGGDEGGDPDAYRTAGDALCAEYETAIAKLGQPSKVTEIGPYIDNALPVLDKAVERVEALDPPAELREAYEAFRDAARQTVDRAKALRAAAEAADADEVQRLLAESTAASKRRVELARAAKLEACSEL